MDYPQQSLKQSQVRIGDMKFSAEESAPKFFCV